MSTAALPSCSVNLEFARSSQSEERWLKIRRVFKVEEAVPKPLKINKDYTEGN